MCCIDFVGSSFQHDTGPEQMPNVPSSVDQMTSITAVGPHQHGASSILDQNIWVGRDEKSVHKNTHVPRCINISTIGSLMMTVGWLSPGSTAGHDETLQEYIQIVNYNKHKRAINVKCEGFFPKE